MKLNKSEIIQYLRHYINQLAMDLLKFNPTLLTVWSPPPPPPPPTFFAMHIPIL